MAAFDLLNEVIRKAEPWSWSWSWPQGKFAVVPPQAFIDEIEEMRVTP